MTQPIIRQVLDIRRLMMVVAMTAFASHAFAATPKTESFVTDRVTLGDIFDGVRGNADYFLAPAPDLGRPLTLNADDLQRVSEAFNLGWEPDSASRKLVIRRASNNIDSYDIQAALQEKIAAQLQGHRFEMELSDPNITLRGANPKDRALTIKKFFYNPAKGEFTATIAAAATPNVHRDVKGRLYEITKVPVLKSPMRPGDVISAADVELVDMREADVSAGAMVDPARLSGMTPRRALQAMKPILAADVQAPVIVKKGQLVTMTLTNNIINVTTQGRALDNGAEGDAIRVMNTVSKQVISGTVTGPRTISVQSPINEL